MQATRKKMKINLLLLKNRRKIDNKSTKHGFAFSLLWTNGVNVTVHSPIRSAITEPPAQQKPFVEFRF